MAHFGIWNKLYCLVMENVRNLLEENMVAAHTIRRKIRLAPRGVRQMSKGYYGAGCTHPGVECLVQRMSKIQTHYACKTNMGLKISASLKLLIVDLVGGQRSRCKNHSKSTTTW